VVCDAASYCPHSRFLLVEYYATTRGGAMSCGCRTSQSAISSPQQDKDVFTIIALMLGPTIVAAFGLWCALYGWAA
jgi:hypothetical protein